MFIFLAVAAVSGLAFYVSNTLALVERDLEGY